MEAHQEDVENAARRGSPVRRRPGRRGGATGAAPQALSQLHRENSEQRVLELCGAFSWTLRSNVRVKSERNSLFHRLSQAHLPCPQTEGPDRLLSGGEDASIRRAVCALCTFPTAATQDARAHSQGRQTITWGAGEEHSLLAVLHFVVTHGLLYFLSFNIFSYI